ncbi:hypothetical protein B0J17DRAFT_631752 [Rhizoctonia solani]|nr:hypothetical protein B0J17DRAFT_631752 [Rhizoctonia solani]
MFKLNWRQAHGVKWNAQGNLMLMFTHLSNVNAIQAIAGEVHGALRLDGAGKLHQAVAWSKVLTEPFTLAKITTHYASIEDKDESPTVANAVTPTPWRDKQTKCKATGRVTPHAGIATIHPLATLKVDQGLSPMFERGPRPL